MKLFLAIIIVVFSFSQKVFATDESSIKKLKFKESGPFYGIKENGRMVRGILKGFQNKGFKTDFYGLFTKNQLYWKGYSEIKYDDGRVFYQYNEYKLDENGKVIIDKDGIYQLVDNYLISEEDFAKVRKYIAYDIPIPFDLYDFEDTKTKIVKKDEISINKLKNKDFNFNSLEEIKSNLKIGENSFKLNLGNFDSGENNIYVELYKFKGNEIGIDEKVIETETIETKYFYVKKGYNYSLSIISSKEFPDYEKYSLRSNGDVYNFYKNIPDKLNIFKKFNNSKNVKTFYSSMLNSLIYISEDKSIQPIMI